MTENYIDKFPLEKEAIDIILSIKDEFVNKIPEDIFVKRYLPMLANKTGDTNLSEWISIAGHVYAEVHVVDTSGNILFTVPSILKRMKTKEHKYANHSVKEIIETSKLHSVNSPIMGERMLEAGLMTTLPEQSESMSDDERWNAILTRYGYSVTQSDKKSETVVSDKPSDDKQFDEYDIA